MRALTIGLAVWLSAPALLHAQSPRWEIGTRFGITRLWREGDGDTFFSLPGGGLVGEPVLQASYFIPSGGEADGPATFLEGEVLLWAGLDSPGGTLFGLGALLRYLPGGAGSGSPYGAISLALLAREGSNVLAPGAAVGYRLPVSAHFAIRLQANYRRWIDPELNELSAVLIVALVGG